MNLSVRHLCLLPQFESKWAEILHPIPEHERNKFFAVARLLDCQA